MNLAWWVLTGGAAGLAAGLFFGDYCAVFKPVGSAYLMLMQSVVYPYVMCSLLTGLGHLTPKTAARLLRASWPFYLLAWGLTYAAMMALATAIPPTPPPPVLDAAALLHRKSDFLSVLLPANFFADITQNQVPAVVVFSLLFGVALQQAKGKETLLSVLDTVRQASLSIWNWVVKLAPAAVFAMVAETAGTVAPAQAGSLLLYLGLFFGGTLFLAFVALPMAVSVFIPVTARSFLKALRDAFVLATVTSLSAVALPFILEAAKKQAELCGAEKAPADEIASTGIAVSYPLGQLGNFFIFLFMLFSLYFFRVKVTALDTWLLVPMSLLSGFGSPSSTVNAVPFLCEWLRVPPGAGVLWLETMTVTRYGMVLLSVAGFGFLTFCCTLHYFGKLRFHPKRALAFVAVTVAFFTLFPLAAARLDRGAPDMRTVHFQDLALSPDLTEGVEVVASPAQPGPEQAAMAPMARIRKNGLLRVGVSTMIIPFAYENGKGDLVGFDVAFAYSLARALGVRLAFVPARLSLLERDFAENRYDILMSGIAVNGERMRDVVYSDGYYVNSLVLVVPEKNLEGAYTMDALRRRKGLRLGVVRKSVLWEMGRRLFPDAELTTLESFDEFARRPDIDGMLWAWDQAGAWTDGHPGYTAVRPDGMDGVLLYGWVMPPDTRALDDFVDHWLALKKADGFYDRQVQTWFKGEPPQKKKRRWSILNDILKKRRAAAAPAQG